MKLFEGLVLHYQQRKDAKAKAAKDKKNAKAAPAAAKPKVGSPDPEPAERRELNFAKAMALIRDVGAAVGVDARDTWAAAKKELRRMVDQLPGIRLEQVIQRGNVDDVLAVERNDALERAIAELDSQDDALDVYTRVLDLGLEQLRQNGVQLALEDARLQLEIDQLQLNNGAAYAPDADSVRGRILAQRAKTANSAPSKPANGAAPKTANGVPPKPANGAPLRVNMPRQSRGDPTASDHVNNCPQCGEATLRLWEYDNEVEAICENPICPHHGVAYAGVSYAVARAAAWRARTNAPTSLRTGT
ncbi:MAG: hypothetical protein LBT97_02995 [Planctomycetota bacterium]|jgi:hypothetical protein|nr:hypothetical protein [Planctomycetota bacterium]